MLPLTTVRLAATHLGKHPLTLERDGFWRWYTPPLDAGTYDLWFQGVPHKLQLDPGDLVVLQPKSVDGKFLYPALLCGRSIRSTSFDWYEERGWAVPNDGPAEFAHAAGRPLRS